MERHARFHGDGLNLAVIMLKNILLSIVTLGIYSFWGRVRTRKFIWQNFELDGQRFSYHATGKELLIGWLKVIAVYSSLSAGIYAVQTFEPDLAPYAQAVMGLVLMFLIPIAIFGARRYMLSRTGWRGIRFGMQPKAKAYLGATLKGYALTIVTFGFYAPVLAENLHQIITEATRFGDATLRYEGRRGEVYGTYVLGYILTWLTLGLYFPFFRAKIIRYRASRTVVTGEQIGTARLRNTVKGGELFGLYAVNIILALLTAGLALPWIICRNAAFFASRIKIDGDIDLAKVRALPSTGNAAADGAAGILDLGFELAF